MVAQTYPWQQSQPQQFQSAPPVVTPLFPQPAPVAPPQLVPQHSVSALLREAERIVPTLYPAYFALLHGVAVLMLLQPGQGYHPTPNETLYAQHLVQGQLLTPHNGGYVLTALGHAVLASFEADAID